jgi:glycosyltransferase involved in cell wall biosynthesis
VASAVTASDQISTARTRERMRILFWNQSFLPTIGGVEVFTARLAGKLIARGHQAMVITDRHPNALPEEGEFDGLPVRRFAFRDALTYRAQDARAGLRLLRDITLGVARVKRDFRPDIVHVNLSDASPLFHLRTLETHPSATVVTLQAALSRRSAEGRSVTGSLFKQAARVVAVSHSAAANIDQYTNKMLAEIDVIAPGISLEEFAAPLIMPATPAPTIVFVGRLVPEKGGETAIAAIALLGGAAKLRIIGEGSERPRLQGLVRERGLDPFVSFEGAVDDGERRRILSESFAMVVPSLHHELFGMVAVEGALAGLPVIASATGGLQEIVEPGRTGFLAPAGDAPALARYLRILLADPALARRMGEAGRANALLRYTIEATTDRYERLYADCLARPQD